jgi:ABC-type transport system substrate-binding protein
VEPAAGIHRQAEGEQERHGGRGADLDLGRHRHGQQDQAFNDVRVRRAVLLALDKAQLAQFAVFGHGMPTHSPFRRTIRTSTSS